MKSRKKTRKILIVDDEPTNIDILINFLKSDYKLVAALNGDKALEIAQSDNPPDLILLDIIMPGMDGYQVCESLKANETTKKIPVIFLTAVSEVMDETKGFKLGAVDYITKPYHPPVVQARIKAHMELKIKSDMLEQLASIDGLTNIYNRRIFDEILKKEWSRTKRSSTPLSLIMIDIDYFKLFNDTYGHAMGDQCLKDVAWTLQDCIKRPSDIVSRYGGEEFAALLPATDHEGAELIASTMRSEIENLEIPNAGSKISEVVTISLGVATTFDGSDFASSETLLKVADNALYNSKNNGRNQITSHKLFEE